jgi:ABC-type phosphate/phosphonate transport system substrate-binding protein
MTQMATNQCKTCGSTIPPDAVAGHCPRCLFGVALSAEEDCGIGSGQRQFGDYELGSQLGAGGMGVVYRARRLRDNRIVAMKLIRDLHLRSPTSLCRFTIEAEAAARLDHPNIVRIQEVGETNGVPYFSMDFIEGESLDVKIARGDFTTKQHSEIAQLVAIIARAVHHAHARGVVHRDLKPANVLIDGQGVPHLTDFGLAKILHPGADIRTLTGSGDLPGTPSYMSPEQVRGADVGYASDIYSLGAILYALLTRHPPFQGATSLEVFQQITEQPPARPRSVQRDLATICLKCLEKDPLRRYSSAEALAEDLENFAEAKPIKARPASLMYRLRQWTKRNPVGTALIVTLCAGLSVALLLLRTVSEQRREIQLDRDLAFDEGMEKISRIWRDPATRAVTISARELGILAGRSPVDVRGAKHQLTLAVSADDGPSSMAQRYARLLSNFQSYMQRQLGEKVAFQLLLLKRFTQEEETLLRGEADFIVLSAVDFLHAQRAAPGIAAAAQASTSREGVIFARTNLVIADLRGRSIAFPDPDLSLTVCAKARLFAAGLRVRDLGFATNVVDEGAEAGQTVISSAEALALVLRGKVDAGVTYRAQFERYRHLGLQPLEIFLETPKVLAARAEIDPRIFAAFRSAVSDAPWPESKFTAGSAALDDLRSALEHAERFEQ